MVDPGIDQVRRDPESARTDRGMLEPAGVGCPGTPPGRSGAAAAIEGSPSRLNVTSAAIWAAAGAFVMRAATSGSPCVVIDRYRLVRTHPQKGLGGANATTSRYRRPRRCRHLTRSSDQAGSSACLRAPDTACRRSRNRIGPSTADRKHDRLLPKAIRACDSDRRADRVAIGLSVSQHDRAVGSRRRSTI